MTASSPPTTHLQSICDDCLAALRAGEVPNHSTSTVPLTRSRGSDMAPEIREQEDTSARCEQCDWRVDGPTGRRDAYLHADLHRHTTTCVSAIITIFDALPPTPPP